MNNQLITRGDELQAEYVKLKTAGILLVQRANEVKGDDEWATMERELLTAISNNKLKHAEKLRDKARMYHLLGGVIV